MRITLSLKRILPVSVLSLFILTVLLSSCANTRQLTYLQGAFDTTQLSKIPFKEPVIRKGDIMSILVYSDNPAATAVFNQMAGPSLLGGSEGSSGGSSGSSSSGSSGGSGGGGSSGSSQTPTSSGYLVDERGNIEFPQLGLFHVEGLTRSVFKDTLETRLKQYLINPYTTIRFLNFKFTLLGEIMRPGIFSLPNEHVNLLEAIGMGGDLTFFGRRDNILVIRDSMGKREFGRLDLTKPEAMASPYFYLQPNDVVYVEASKKKAAANDQSTLRIITISATVVSTLAILYSLFHK